MLKTSEAHKMKPVKLGLSCYSTLLHIEVQFLNQLIITEHGNAVPVFERVPLPSIKPHCSSAAAIVTQIFMQNTLDMHGLSKATE